MHSCEEILQAIAVKVLGITWHGMAWHERVEGGIRLEGITEESK